MASLSSFIPSPEASSSSAGSTSSPATRPVTSKARGVCKYYTDPRGCYAKDKCKFLHSEPPKEGDPSVLTPYDNSKTCKFYLQGFCKRGDGCWFQHTEPKDKANGPDVLGQEDDSCSICFEKPMIYGLLSGCSHIFCINCIKQWRDPSNKPGSVIESGNTKKCPMCREPSRFITPSSKFWRDGSPEKLKTIEAYRDSMAKVPCKYFQKSLLKDKNKPLCPFGKDCFYQHKKEDGTLHEFKDGAEVSLRRYHATHRHGSRNVFSFLGGFDFDGETVIPFFGGFDPHHLRATANANRTSATLRQGQLLHDTLLNTTLDALRTHVAQYSTLRDQFQATSEANGAPPTGNTGTARNGNNRAAGGPDTSRRPRTGGIPRPPETDDMFNLMHLMDILREQLDLDPPTASAIPPAPTTGTRASGASAAGSRTATRNGTAVVADADEESDDDEPPPILIPEERPRRSPTRTRTGYDSDNSMPALQVVSDSSDEEDNDESGAEDVSEDDGFHDEDEDEDQFDPGTLDPDLFFRQLFGVSLDAAVPELRARSHMQTAESRPNSSARFSTVVDRSANGSGSASGSANRSTPVASSPGSPGRGSGQPISLMEWAENILMMDDEQEDTDDDDDEPMPALEPIPHHTPPLSSPSAPSLSPPVVNTNNQARSGASLQQTQRPIQPQYRDVETESDSPPPLIDALTSVPVPSRQSSAHNAHASRSSPSVVQVESAPVATPAEGAPSRKAERKATMQQEFTTDGRGRVISIGGPELPVSASFAEPQVSDRQPDAGEGYEEEVAEEVSPPLAPVAMQRKSSEFTTDGRGRVISVGHSVSSGSSSALGITQDGERSIEAGDNERQESRRNNGNGEDGGNGRGLFAWFNALF